MRPSQSANPAALEKCVSQRTSVHDRCRRRTPLPDRLSGAGEKIIRHGQAEGLGGLEIGDELEPGRQLDRQLARLGTIEDAIDIGGRTPVAVGEVLAVADQSSRLYALPEREDRRHRCLSASCAIRSRCSTKNESAAITTALAS